jgi:hypothetical protein
MRDPLAFFFRPNEQTPLRAALALASFLVAGGCSPPPRTVKVVGRVTHNGVPVEGATVVFYAEQHAEDLSASGRTDAEGRYELRTFFSGSDIALGAVPNDYVVAIYKYEPPRIERARLKIQELRKVGGDVRRYIAEEAAHDIWPDGVPDGWPDGYVPGESRPPENILNNEELHDRLGQLTRGIPFLPARYADKRTTDLRAAVEPSAGPLTFDFDLTGNVEDLFHSGEGLSKSDLSG